MLHRVVQLATSGIQTHDFSRDDTDSKSDYHDHEPDSPGPNDLCEVLYRKPSFCPT
jgi:hypothetical protein